MMTVNLSHQCRCPHFSLVEVVFVTVIMGFVTLALMNLYLFPFRIWQINTANTVMALQGKIIREKILGGVGEDAGLRAAMLNSLHIGSNQLDYDMDTQLPPTLGRTDDDLSCALSFNTWDGLVTQSIPGSSQPVPLSRQMKRIRNLNFTLSNRILTTRFEMQQDGMFNNVITIPVLIETYITNP